MRGRRSSACLASWAATLYSCSRACRARCCLSSCVLFLASCVPDTAIAACEPSRKAPLVEAVSALLHSASSFTYAACSLIEALPSPRAYMQGRPPYWQQYIPGKAVCPCGRTRCLACPGGMASGRTLTSRCGQAHAAYLNLDLHVNLSAGPTHTHTRLYVWVSASA